MVHAYSRNTSGNKVRAAILGAVLSLIFATALQFAVVPPAAATTYDDVLRQVGLLDAGESWACQGDGLEGRDLCLGRFGYQPSTTDQVTWGTRSFIAYTGNCTHYAAWRAKRDGMPSIFDSSDPAGLTGDAKYWDDAAGATSSSPARGAIAVWDGTGYSNHVAYVEYVHYKADGTVAWIATSESKRDTVDGVPRGGGQRKVYTPGSAMYDGAEFILPSGVVPLPLPTLGASTPLTRQGVATLLYRAAGSPEVHSPSGPIEAAELPTVWMESKGISEFTSTANLSSTVTRGDFARYSYAAFGDPAFTPPVNQSFDIAPTPVDPLYRAVEWMVSVGMTVPSDSFNNYNASGSLPMGTAVVMLYRHAGEPAVSDPSERIFADVTPNTAIGNAVNWAHSAGMVGDPFTDVSDTAPFAAEIRWMSTTGLSTGYDDGTFRPSASVSRQAMAAYLYRIAGEPAFTDPAVASFPDVPIGHPFYTEISWMVDQGITTGYDDGTFRPSSAVTRQAFAAFLHRLAGEPTFEPRDEDPFSDVPPEDQFFQPIEWLASTGISTGYDDGSFRPGASLSRQAAATFLFRYDQRFGG